MFFFTLSLIIWEFSIFVNFSEKKKAGVFRWLVSISEYNLMQSLITSRFLVLFYIGFGFIGGDSRALVEVCALLTALLVLDMVRMHTVILSP